MRASPFSSQTQFPLLGICLHGQVGNGEFFSARNGGMAVDLAGGVRACLRFGRKAKRPWGSGPVITLSNGSISAESFLLGRTAGPFVKAQSQRVRSSPRGSFAGGRCRSYRFPIPGSLSGGRPPDSPFPSGCAGPLGRFDAALPLMVQFDFSILL